MAWYNPTLALQGIDSSLVNKMGGLGIAGKALGDSLTNVGQAKLALQQKKDEDERAKAMLTLAQNADTRADSAVKQAIVDKAQAKQEKFDSNVANNSYLYQAMGLPVPNENTPELARLGTMDPTITALSLKEGGDKYSGTAGGIIYNKKTGEVKGDYRTDKGANDPFKGVPFLDGVGSNGRPMRTYFNADGSIKLNLVAPSQNSGTYNIGYSDAVGDNNVPQRTTSQKTTNDTIEANGHVEKGFLPIRLTGNPVIDKKMKSFAVPKGGGWYVPPTLVNDFMKQFPKKK